jgi:hypothetical protein
LVLGLGVSCFWTAPAGLPGGRTLGVISDGGVRHERKVDLFLGQVNFGDLHVDAISQADHTAMTTSANLDASGVEFVEVVGED